MSDGPIGERITALETWTAGHEKLCAERYGSLRGDLKWILRGMVGLLLAISAWLAIQLWNDSQARLLALEHPAGIQAGTSALSLSRAAPVHSP